MKNAWVKQGLVGGLAVAILAGCQSGGGDSAGSGDSGSGGKEGKITLKMARDSFTDVHPASKDLWMWKKYEEKTGIHIEWEEIPGESSAERKNVMLASGKLPDAFYQTGFSSSELVKYGEQGLFLPLEDLIEQHAPNLKQWFEKNPEVKKAITMPDGHIYSLPYIDTALPYRSIRLYINKTWLDNLGLQVPKTTDELQAALKAFKEKDANGNGDPNDEMGWVMPTGFINGMFERQLYGSFGMGNGGVQGGGKLDLQGFGRRGQAHLQRSEVQGGAAVPEWTVQGRHAAAAQLFRL
ncbi:extracellular solute-binding protein [Paenibacillus sp. P22]|uniref:extracellular solute-binding protein n=1 Tax=Paenibacillus sp. P22 TaxID=483908 RepID=UPI001E4A96A6|nr:extracellular solute-binding protein [Paenibacillus sp. P22]